MPLLQKYNSPVVAIANAVVAIVDETLDMYIKTRNQVVVPKIMDVMADALRGAIAMVNVAGTEPG